MTSSKQVDTLICHTTMCKNLINFLYNPGHVTLWCVEVGPMANARGGFNARTRLGYGEKELCITNLLRHEKTDILQVEDMLIKFRIRVHPYLHRRAADLVWFLSPPSDEPTFFFTHPSPLLDLHNFFHVPHQSCPPAILQFTCKLDLLIHVIMTKSLCNMKISVLG